MAEASLWKVQTPALRWRRPGARRDTFAGAHNFIAVKDGEGRVRAELHGIARGPGGVQLRIYGGVLPFRKEVIWGERFDHQTGFYDRAFPQAPLMEADTASVAVCLSRADAVRQAVNRLGLLYPWPALFGANSNAYYATLLAGMGLEDVRAPDQLWAPSAGRLLLSPSILADIRTIGATAPIMDADGAARSELAGISPSI